MSELPKRKIIVNSYLIHYGCDKYGCNGNVIKDDTGLTIQDDKIIISHRCRICDTTYGFEEISYPKLVQEYIEE